MAWRNSSGSFGLFTRLLHWAMAAGIIGMFGLGTRLVWMKPSLANLWLFGLHKSLGLSLLGLVMVRLIWHRISPPPPPIGPPTAWETRAARAAHRALYALLLAVPLSGWVASSATGIDTMLFGHWVVPPIAPVSELWETRGFAVHGVLTKTLFGLVLLHALAALKRHAAGDGTLLRMLRGLAVEAPPDARGLPARRQ